MDCASFLSQVIGFKGGVLTFACSYSVFNLLWLCLIFYLGFRFLQFSWECKGLVQFLYDKRRKCKDLDKRVCSKLGFEREFESKIGSCDLLKLRVRSTCGNKDDFGGAVCDGDFDKETCVEDGIFDVKVLRKLVKLERMRGDIANVELEKERMSAATAADEAMAMIMRLQSEKSSIEVEGNQYRRLAEQRQEYEEEVIQALQCMLMEYECEKAVLEEKLRLCREKLKQFMSIASDELEQFEGSDSFSSFPGSAIEHCYGNTPGNVMVDSKIISA